MRSGIYSVAYRNSAITKASVTNPFKRAYCALHGYDYLYIEGENCEERRPTWKKVEYAVKLLPKYDLLMWIDADAAPVDFSRRIEDFTRDGFDFFIGKDVISWDGRAEYFNAGAFIMRNCEWTFKMLDEWWRRSFRVRRSRMHQDQPELNDIYKENWMVAKDHVRVLDLEKREFQSVTDSAYCSGMFIKHCAASRYRTFKEKFWRGLDEKKYAEFGIRKN